jgi:hypothetical protein
MLGAVEAVFDERVMKWAVQQWPQQAHPPGRVPSQHMAQPAAAELWEHLEAVLAVQPPGTGEPERDHAAGLVRPQTPPAR